ncbi:MAG: XdhC family protein [Cellulomonas sp.]|uniref:XdhC family protein n=1 Tax=Cellulomonas sp. TaxID=40001 RepID=UPI0017C9F87E|nr:XdhC/CoxI family protein [Cellulomonas sp.]NMM30447.1 XdhC family protein [Cellulomonas sp.]
MLEIAGQILDALDSGNRLAVATVTAVRGSAPRALGTAMAVSEDGTVVGSISGGCVEADIYALSGEVLADGGCVLTEFGVTEGDALAAGLSCGGSLEVFVVELAPGGHRNPIGAGLRAELEAARRGDPAGLAIVVDGPGAGTILAAGQAEPAQVRLVQAGSVQAPVGDIDAVDRSVGGGLDHETERQILAGLRARLASGSTATEAVACGGSTVRVLYLVATRPPRLLVFGAVDFAAALCDAGALLGYRVTVCDARAVFATAARFPTAHEVIIQWPADYLAGTPVDSRTVVVVLTHDEKFDLPLLTVALRRGVGYVGAMGSRRTHERRVARLLDAGVSRDELARLHSPIGLDLGASTPAETAVSILAEVLAARTGTTGRPLARVDGPIHPV